MMETIVVVAVVLVSAVYLLRQFCFKPKNKRGACNGCDKCGGH